VVKAPRVPPTLTLDESDVRESRDPLFRIFKRGGVHPMTWKQLRRFGPIAGMRFDPFVPPAQPQLRGVMYASTSLKTAFAEVFQRERVISARDGATLAAWTPTRPLVLVDLTSDFLIRNGAGAGLMMGPKRFTQEWAEAIDRSFGDQIDGLWHLSSMTSQPIVTLFSRAADPDSFPSRPGLHRGLDDPLMRGTIAAAADTIGYGVRVGP
jgi:hypothetical protein